MESAGSERPPFERLAVETRRLVYKHRFAEVVESRTRVPIVDVSECASFPQCRRRHAICDFSPDFTSYVVVTIKGSRPDTKTSE